jgi:hypothetical protein
MDMVDTQTYEVKIHNAASWNVYSNRSLKNMQTLLQSFVCVCVCICACACRMWNNMAATQNLYWASGFMVIANATTGDRQVK